MRMMDKQDTTRPEHMIEDVEHLLHRATVILIATMDFADGVNNDELWFDRGYDLVQIRHIIDLLEDVERRLRLIRCQHIKVATQ